MEQVNQNGIQSCLLILSTVKIYITPPSEQTQRMIHRTYDQPPPPDSSNKPHLVVLRNKVLLPLQYQILPCKPTTRSYTSTQNPSTSTIPTTLVILTGLLLYKISRNNLALKRTLTML